MGFPALDVVPPTNSSFVQQWIAEVAASGVKIPNIPLSVDGSCGSDPAKVANTSICWWTCGGCTRDTDVVTCPDKVCLVRILFEKGIFRPRSLLKIARPRVRWTVC